AAPAVHAAPARGSLAGAYFRAGLGLRLRRRVEGHRGVRPLSAREARSCRRAPPDSHRAGRRLRPANGVARNELNESRRGGGSRRPKSTPSIAHPSILTRQSEILEDVHPSPPHPL